MPQQSRSQRTLQPGIGIRDECIPHHRVTDPVQRIDHERMRQQSLRPRRRDAAALHVEQRPRVQFADRRAARIEQRFHGVVAASPELDPSEALARVFTDEGYAASVREVPVGEQLCQQHCPVSHVAHEFPELCEAETAAISRMLGRHVQRLATIAHGDGVCTTCIPDLKTHADKEKVTR